MTTLCLVLLLCVGCGGARVETPEYPPPAGDLQLTVQRTRSNDLRIGMVLKGTGGDTSEQMRFVRDVRHIRTVLFHPGQGVLDSINYHLVSSATGRGADQSLLIESEYVWRNALGLSLDSIYTLTTLDLSNGKTYGVGKGFVFPADTGIAALPAVRLKGWVEEQTDTSALFVALAERLRIIDEYFPTSERLRVVLTDSDGAVVWHSSQGLVFAQAIAPVDPDFVGQVRRYELHWNGRRRDGTPLPPGRYTAVLTLPARPAPYSVSIPLNWRTDDDN